MWEKRWRITSGAEWRTAIGGLSRLPLDFRQPIEVVVRPERAEKSHEQRGYWHILLRDLGRELGYTKDEMKQVIRREFFGSRWVTLPSGERYEVIPSSEEADRTEYSELIELTLRVGAENGVILSDPRPK